MIAQAATVIGWVAAPYLMETLLFCGISNRTTFYFKELEMDIYKKANQIKLRFATNKGLLSVEQLYDLSLKDLDTLAVSLKVESTPRESFLVETSAQNEIAQLSFDIALDVLQTKMKEQKEAREALETKRKKDKILDIIARKQDASLENMSIEELTAMI